MRQLSGMKPFELFSLFLVVENEYFIVDLLPIEVFPPDNCISGGIDCIDFPDDSALSVLNIDSELLLLVAQTANVNKAELGSLNNELHDSVAGVIFDWKAIEAELFDSRRF